MGWSYSSGWVGHFPWTQGIEAKGGAFIAFLRDAGKRSVRGLTAWLEAGGKGDRLIFSLAS